MPPLDEGSILDQKPADATPGPTPPTLQPARKGPGRHPKDCACGRCGQSSGAKRPKDNTAIDSRSDAEWRQEVAAAWLGLWILIKAIGWIFGYAGDDLTEDEANQDAINLTPIFKRHPSLAKVLSWIGAPVVIVRRVTQKFHKKEATPAVPEQRKLNPVTPIKANT